MNIDKINNKILKNTERVIGRGSTTSTVLTEYGKQLFGKKYVGTFSADTIPHMAPNTYAIVNLDDHEQPGSHWVALVKEKDHIIVYDSFGRKTIKILPELYKQNGEGVILESENDPEQTVKEDNCGARCISALILYDKYGKEALLNL